jgi:DNA-binding CsgD family transcriptional regulator
MFAGFFRSKREFKHYGVARRSGRYPYGSGEEPTQRGTQTISERAAGFRRKGLSEKETAVALGMSIATLRSQKSLEKAQARAADVAQAQTLQAKGLSQTAIGAQMGINESSVRSLLNREIAQRSQITKETADMLRRAVGEDKYVDVGMGVEAQLGVSNSRLKTSVKMLENEGYVVHKIQTDQLGTDKKTTVKVVTPPGTTYKDVVTNKHRIILPQERSDDGGRSFLGVKPPVSISSKRIQIIHKEDGGGDRDGLIELRRGAPDLSLGTSRYAQVRIAVDGTHYLKGMALPVNNLPPGVDIRFYTSKSKETPLTDTLKKLSDDPDNPFGSTIKQFDYTDASGKKRQSPLNIVGSEKSPNQEGRWDQWSRALSSQILSKQPTGLAEQQLAIVVRQKQKDFEEISKLTNPAVKRRLLDSLADDCDSSAVHLKAAAMPRQRNHVLLPIVNMPDHQVYAPNYKNGEKVVLIRHPHGGKFEIPELMVNNNHRDAKRILGNAKDAVGISPTVAKRLSGADFDGDHVLIIPNPSHGKSRIQTSSPLDGLKDFDPQIKYPYVPGMKVMGEKKGGNKQHAMGDISNLITDMTIKAASPQEIAAAVRHSMVVIDSEKHKLN